jgi:hypothetical protein
VPSGATVSDTVREHEVLRALIGHVVKGRPNAFNQAKRTDMVRKGILIVLCVLTMGLGVAAADRTDGFPFDSSDVIGRAEKGNPAAQTYLGLAYELGEGMPQDPRAAVRWYERAAEQGNPDSQLYLGAAYATGSGVLKDHILACVWINLAIPHLTGEDREAAKQLLDRVVWDMTRAQLAAAVRLEQAWLENLPASSGASKGFRGDR